MVNNLIEFEFKKGILVIDIKIKITVVNFIYIFKKICDVQSVNKFKFIAVRFKDGKVNIFLVAALKLYVSEINGYIIILDDEGRNSMHLPKYYVVNNINYIFDIFSTIA